MATLLYLPTSFLWWQAVAGIIGVTDCNGNGSGLQSTKIWDQIICLYPSLQDGIICHRDCFYPAGTAIDGGGTTLHATHRNHRLRPVFMRGEAYASLENALEVLLSRTSLDLGPRVSHHTSRDRKSTRLNSSHLGISYAV